MQLEDHHHCCIWSANSNKDERFEFLPSTIWIITIYNLLRSKIYSCVCSLSCKDPLRLHVFSYTTQMLVHHDTWMNEPESPAWTTLFLVLYCSYCTFLSPNNDEKYFKRKMNQSMLVGGSATLGWSTSTPSTLFGVLGVMRTCSLNSCGVISDECKFSSYVLLYQRIWWVPKSDSWGIRHSS